MLMMIYGIRIVNKHLHMYKRWRVNVRYFIL